jgi:hypothetical protein
VEQRPRIFCSKIFVLSSPQFSKNHLAGDDYICDMVELNLDLADLRRQVKNVYRDIGPEGLERATYRALNHSTRKAKVQASRYARKKMRLKSAEIKKQIKVGLARKGKLHSSLGASSSPMRVKDFPHGQRRKGVSVGISPGKRKTIKRAFVARMRNGHQGVFARGRYRQGQGFDFDRKGKPDNRNRITQLMTTSVPQKLDDRELQPILLRTLQENFPKRLSHLLGRESDFGPSPVKF